MYSSWAVWCVRAWKQHTSQNSKTQPRKWSEAGHGDVFPPVRDVNLHTLWLPTYLWGPPAMPCLSHTSNFLPSSGACRQPCIWGCCLPSLTVVWRHWFEWNTSAGHTCGVCTCCCACFLFPVLLAWECNCLDLVFLAVCTGEFPFLEFRFITTSLFLSCLLMCFLKRDLTFP